MKKYDKFVKKANNLVLNKYDEKLMIHYDKKKKDDIDINFYTKLRDKKYNITHKQMLSKPLLTYDLYDNKFEDSSSRMIKYLNNCFGED